MQGNDNSCHRSCAHDVIPKSAEQDMLTSDNADNTSSNEKTSQPWASGRVLSAAQRARKRELDKRSSRLRRRSLKHQITQLNEKVENLLQDRTYALNSTRDFISSQSAESGKHREASSTNSPLTLSEQSFSPWTSLSEVDHSDKSISPQIFNTQPVRHSHQNGTLPSDFSSAATLLNGEFDDNGFYFDYLPPDLPAFSGSPTVSLPQSSMLQAEAVLDDAVPATIDSISRLPLDPVTAASTGSTMIFWSFNKLLHQAHRLRPSQVCLDDDINQNALISAVLQGWDSIGLNGIKCPLWNVLRHIDNQVFCVASITTRLTMLRMIHLMLLCQAKSESYNELPPWYRPRPTQRKLRHEVVKGYFAWPGLRERLVLSHDTILTDAFFEQFAKSFRLHWPHNDEDVYTIDASKGMFQFSGCFLNYLFDINKWRMESTFFVQYPDIYEDIEPAEPIVRSLNLDSSFAPATRYLLPAPTERNNGDEEAETSHPQSAQSGELFYIPY